MRLLTAVVVVLAAPLAAQPAATPDSSPFEEGDQALLFQIGPDLDFGSFAGSVLSYKWHQSPTKARRIGLSGFFDVGVEDQAAGGGEVDQGTNYQRGHVGLSLVSLTYRRGETPVVLYHGVGPTVSGFVSRNESEARRADDAFAEETVQTSFEAQAGLAGVLGVEWPVADAIGLIGEYGVSLTGRYRRTRLTQTSPPDGVETTLSTDGYGLQFGSSGAKLGVSVYF